MVLWAAACSGSTDHVPAGRLTQNSAVASSNSFSVTSSTFTNNGRIPLVMVFNQCHGSNRSPQLSWRNPPAGTRSYAIVMFDQTANFGHWGIYNIRASTTSLPENAGAAGNTFGIQTNNDFPLHGYDGPCPPPGLNHRYVFTVYALDGNLYISSSAMFPSNVEGLLWTMEGHVLGQATITGFFST
jgi:Raf kinase inhibitor-like YbhB/YbcL family protein